MRATAIGFSILILAASGVAIAADSPAPIAAAVADTARPAADTTRDANRHPAEIVAFAGVKPGDSVLEIFPEGGYYTRILSKLVGPTGHVYAYTPQEILKVFPTAADGPRALAADPNYSNVSELLAPALATNLPHVDVVWTTLNYHDMHVEKFYPGLDIGAFNRMLLAALKPGGIYFVNDHVAAAGSGLRDVSTLHRIDPEAAKSEITAAGFVFDGESAILRNPADTHAVIVFDPAIRGKTDQFVFRFRRPAS